MFRLLIHNYFLIQAGICGHELFDFMFTHCLNGLLQLLNGLNFSHLSFLSQQGNYPVYVLVMVLNDLRLLSEMLLFLGCIRLACQVGSWKLAEHVYILAHQQACFIILFFVFLRLDLRLLHFSFRIFLYIWMTLL